MMNQNVQVNKIFNQIRCLFFALAIVNLFFATAVISNVHASSVVPTTSADLPAGYKEVKLDKGVSVLLPSANVPCVPVPERGGRVMFTIGAKFSGSTKATSVHFVMFNPQGSFSQERPINKLGVADVWHIMDLGVPNCGATYPIKYQAKGKVGKKRKTIKKELKLTVDPA